MPTLIERAVSLEERTSKKPFILCKSERLLNEWLPYHLQRVAGGNIVVRDVEDIEEVLAFIAGVRAYGISFWVEVRTEEDVDRLREDWRVHPLILEDIGSRDLIQRAAMSNRDFLLMEQPVLLTRSLWKDLIIECARRGNHAYLWPMSYEGIEIAQRALRQGKAKGLILPEELCWMGLDCTHVGIVDEYVPVTLYTKLKVWMKKIKKRLQELFKRI